MRPENWIKWDLASREDHATKWFLQQYQDKASAYGFFVWIVEQLYYANGNRIEASDIFVEGFAAEIGWSAEAVGQAIARLIKAKLFFAEDGFIYSKRVLREVQSRQKLSDARAEAGRKGGLKRVENSGTCKQLASKPEQVPGKFKQSQAEERRGEERRIEENTVNTQSLSFPGPDVCPPDIDPEIWLKAVTGLPDPTEPPQPWQNSNQFMNVGRRPMLKYPDLWFTQRELADTLTVFGSKGLPQTHWKEVFQKAQANAVNKRANGTRPDRFAAFIAVTGWALEEVLKQYNEEVKIRRNRTAGGHANGLAVQERPRPKEFVSNLPPKRESTAEERAERERLMREKIPGIARKMDMNRPLDRTSSAAAINGPGADADRQAVAEALPAPNLVT